MRRILRRGDGSGEEGRGGLRGGCAGGKYCERECFMAGLCKFSPVRKKCNLTYLNYGIWHVRGVVGALDTFKKYTLQFTLVMGCQVLNMFSSGL